MSERPIFIVGAHRSGTTLLRYMLGSHPRLYIPPESDFIPRLFLDAPHRRLDEREVARLLSIIWSYRFVKEWQGEPPIASALLDRMATPTPAAFLDTLYHAYARQYGAERWGDKTPIYASYIPLLDTLFPEAQVVHIVRDGRDVALSMLDKWGRKEPHVDILFGARNWVRRLRAVRSAAARLPADRFFELHYEALVADPEPRLRELAHFLGERYVPEMAAPQRLGQARIRPGSFHAPIREAPSTARVDRWRREMSAPDRRLFERIAAPMLAAYGYEVGATEPLPAAERLRFHALDAKYHLLQGGRAVAQRLGLVPPI